MRLGKRQIDCLKRFGETPHPKKEGHIHWRWGDWHLAKKARTADGIWPVMRLLIANGLLEVAPSDKWPDVFQVRTTVSGRAALERRA